MTKNGRLLNRPFLDISSRVDDGGEGGLLSIAFSPRYRSKPVVFVAYTTLGNDLRVAKFRADSPSSNHVSASTGRTVITVPHPDEYDNHFAGQLAFGPTGLLFLSTGDGGGGGDPYNVSQNKRSLQGKVLRLRVLGAKRACGKAYCSPSTNPYAGAKPGRAEVWLTGLRNAWRFSVDPATGDLWIADVGQGESEEVNRVPAGVGGRNLGWSCREGFRVYDASRCKSRVRYHDPVAAYGRDFGSSVTGGFVYRGSRFAGVLGGTYVAGDFGSGRVFTLENGDVDAVASLPMVSSFGEDDQRELWAVTIDGRLFELTGAR